MQIPFVKSLESSKRVLIAGCGGGFDILSGLPIHSWLKAAGKQVFMANLSFSRVDLACRERIGPSAWVVDDGCEQMTYFPERRLSEWLALRGDDPTVIAFEKTGVLPLRASYEAVVTRFGIDTIILVDGGTDSVIKGDEALLGTVEEDAASIGAVDMVVGPRKFLACLGFGIGACQEFRVWGLNRTKGPRPCRAANCLLFRMPCLTSCSTAPIPAPPSTRTASLTH